MFDLARFIKIIITGHLALSLQANGAEESPEVLREVEKLIAAQQDGYQWQGLLMRPELSYTGQYDSNIFATRNAEVDDFIQLLEASVSAETQWKKHMFSFDFGSAKGVYDTNSRENYTDYWASVGGRYDVSDNTNLFGGLGHARDHEQRGSIDVLSAGNIPTEYSSDNAHAGVIFTRDKATLRVGGTFESLDYDNAPPLNNQDRDREMTGLGARLSVKVNPRRTVYVQAITDERDYKTTTDDFGYMRDSGGYRLDIGLQAALSNRLKSEIYFGQIHQNYDEPRFTTINTLDFGGRLSWRAAPRTVWSAILDRSLEETTLSGASGFIYTQLSGQVKHLVTPRITMTASVSLAEAEYQGVDREDTYASASLGARYHFVPNWYLDAGYRLSSRDSSDLNAVNNPANIQASSDFSRNQVYLTLGSLLYPVKKGAYWDAPSGESLDGNNASFSGLYIGAQAGHDILALRTQGNRGGSGTDNGQLSNAGNSAGVFAGIGQSYDQFYIGAELEAEASNSEVFHIKDKTDSRTYRVRKRHGFAAAFRTGYLMPSGPLLYGRLGPVRGRFDEYFTLNNALSNAYDVRDDVPGWRYGIGLDVPVSDDTFIRFDYTHTNYDAFLADVVTEAETIDISEDLFHLGIARHFGGTLSHDTIQMPVDAAGPYAGVMLGYGALQSTLNGVHNDSDGMGGSVTSNFVGDFGGNAGATGGVFVGYGGSRNQAYLGVEGELENSTTNWTHTRTPNGRNFSVNKKDSLALGLRGGYILDNDSLIYARVAGVRTRFNTTWAKGGNALNDVDRDDRVNGVRYGVGVDTPVTRTTFLRLDYSVTNYSAYRFVSSHGNPDTMEFANSDALLRLGFGVRF